MAKFKKKSTNSVVFTKTDAQKEEDKKRNFIDLKEELQTEGQIPGRGENVDEYLKSTAEDIPEKKKREGDEDWEAYKEGRIGRF